MNTTEEFWRAFLKANPDVTGETPYQVWYFGNSSEMARELSELVLFGTKTATASLLETNKLQPENAPVDDGYSVVTDFEGKPLCVIQTAEIRHIPFRDVDAAFAYDEGEDDQTLESWRKGHWDYFTKEAARLGFAFDENSIVCCERFRLLFPK
jgi:uncharacterized protein YhfF